MITADPTTDLTPASILRWQQNAHQLFTAVLRAA